VRVVYIGLLAFVASACSSPTPADPIPTSAASAPVAADRPAQPTVLTPLAPPTTTPLEARPARDAKITNAPLVPPATTTIVVKTAEPR
jgi:hypothetical protein